jgi:hypothetical protein
MSGTYGLTRVNVLSVGALRGCGRCGAALVEGHRFCGHCGAPAGDLGCQLLLDRAADLSPAEPRIGAPMVTAPGPGESAAVGDG